MPEPDSLPPSTFVSCVEYVVISTPFGNIGDVILDCNKVSYIDTTELGSGENFLMYLRFEQERYDGVQEVIGVMFTFPLQTIVVRPRASDGSMCSRALRLVAVQNQVDFKVENAPIMWWVFNILGFSDIGLVCVEYKQIQ
jgi:hypothetical protein